jgi:hypothetical protein
LQAGRGKSDKEGFTPDPLSTESQWLTSCSMAWSAALILAAVSVAFMDVRHAPVQITTDTPAYCATLQARLSKREKQGRLSAKARELAQNGGNLCANGDIIGGITALRQAMVLSLHENRIGKPDK